MQLHRYAIAILASVLLTPAPLTFAASAVTGATPSLRQSVEPRDLLQRVRNALKAAGKAWPATLVSGKAIINGVERPYSFAFLPDGGFVQSFGGSLSKTIGNDGRRYWQEDASHFVQELYFGDRDREMAINLLLSDNWLFASAPIRVTAADNTVHVVFKETGVALDLRIDPATNLPTEASFETSDGATIRLSDWRAVGDRRIPMHVEITADGEAQTYIATNARSIYPGDVHAEMPESRVSAAEFDPLATSRVDAAFAGKAHIMVRALVNGQDVGWFILDSGAAAMMIDKAIADSLHLDRLSGGSATGVGGTVASSARSVETFRIGPMTLRDVRFRDYDFSAFNSGSGPRIVGLIGTPLFRRAVVAISWNGPTVDVYDRSTFKLPNGTWQTLRFRSDNPAVLARLSDTPQAWYVLDTGGSGFLILHTPFVQKWKLLAHRETDATTSNGLGGSVAARSGTVKWFELGSRRFDNPTVVFSTTTVGGFAESYLAGNIGVDALKAFTLVLDFAGSRVAFLN